MLHDTQKFHVDGRTKEDLKATIELLMKLDGGKIGGYKFDENEIVFMFSVPSQSEGVNLLPKTDNPSLIADLCWDWLVSNKRPSEKEDPYFDGTTRLGWELKIENGFFASSFKVTPTWLYYGK